MPDDYLEESAGLAGRAGARPLADLQRLREARCAVTSGATSAGRGARIVAPSRASIRSCSSASTSIPDTYMNPFFDEQQWYDYNPGTLRQFRHWLAGTGPYAGATEPRRSRPALVSPRASRSRSPRSIADRAREQWRSWERGRPAARVLRAIRARRAVLGRSVVAGMGDVPPPSRRAPLRRAVAVAASRRESRATASCPRRASSRRRRARSRSPSTSTSPARTTTRAACRSRARSPRDGHLGAVLYGEAAVNNIKMEEPHSRCSRPSRAIDPAGRSSSTTPPICATRRRCRRTPQAYRAFPRHVQLRRALRCRRWPGTGATASLRGPARVRRPSPRGAIRRSRTRRAISSSSTPTCRSGARLWTFGTPRHADGDGWVAERGTIACAPGALAARSTGCGRPSTLVSPRGLGSRRERSTARRWDCARRGDRRA